MLPSEAFLGESTQNVSQAEFIGHCGELNRSRIHIIQATAKKHRLDKTQPLVHFISTPLPGGPWRAVRSSPRQALQPPEPCPAHRETLP